MIFGTQDIQYDLATAKHKLNLLHFLSFINNEEEHTRYQFFIDTFVNDPLLIKFFDMYEFIWNEPFFIAPKERITWEVIYGYDHMENDISFFTPYYKTNDDEEYRMVIMFVFSDPLISLGKDNLKNYENFFSVVANSPEYKSLFKDVSKESFLLKRGDSRISWFDCQLREPLHFLADHKDIQGNSHITILEDGLYSEDCEEIDSEEDVSPFEKTLCFLDWRHPNETRSYVYFVELNEKAAILNPRLKPFLDYGVEKFYKLS